jgi:hypothetical protein
LTNSDVNLLRFFRRFLAESFSVQRSDLVFHLHVYTGNGLSLREIERYWLGALDLEPTSMRKHRVNARPTSRAAKRGSKLPYGVCTLRVLRSTQIVQHIYGAIQEYGEFREPRWLD